MSKLIPFSGLIAALMLWSGGALAQTPTLPPATPLPALSQQGHVDHAGASIWYGIVGEGSPVLLLHGGRATSLSWGAQVAALVAGKHRVILIESRGHGRSTLGTQPLSYELMESDVVAVMDALGIGQTDVAGWSDGANISLVMAMRHPERVKRIFAFGPNMNQRYLTPPRNSPLFAEVGARLEAEYASVAADPRGFGRLTTEVRKMQAVEPNYSDAQLAATRGPRIAIVGASEDEFISRRHLEYVASTIPGATLIMLDHVSHFAPWQDAATFNNVLTGFLQ
ncbi:pimeloyl-ACP methyl ester carboxylesterase [Duganella sp. 1224]|uniref:alpha/beta fold hydrolase n=1 Tax=Duganella sp. 1224 TaxID=2587052 RepID=UPI0015C73490|nr:alpha/beta hydrolase [Duganella sp. 1224]NYE59685.1 pimeloyl-ACP methyl ester carboxylesterase [Duganella sp. 1224]